MSPSASLIMKCGEWYLITLQRKVFQSQPPKHCRPSNYRIWIGSGHVMLLLHVLQCLIHINLQWKQGILLMHWISFAKFELKLIRAAIKILPYRVYIHWDSCRRLWVFMVSLRLRKMFLSSVTSLSNRVLFNIIHICSILSYWMSQ